MGDTTGVDLNLANQAAAMIMDTTAQLSQAYQNLVNVMTETDGCIGNDPSGKQLAQQYTPNAEKFTSSVSAFVPQLTDSANEVSQSLADFEDADIANASGVNSSD